MSDRTHWEGCHTRHLECALARLADVDARLTDAIAKHGEVARKYGESLARLAEKQEAIGKAYFLLWTTPTHLKTVHKARRALLDAMTKDEQHEVMGRYAASCSPMIGDNAAPDPDLPADSADAVQE